MISVKTALEIISQNTVDFGTELIPLSGSVNRMLKEDWCADRDFPPYHRVTMDGIAFQYAAFEKGQRNFPIQGIAAAGMSKQLLQNNTDCLEVMTGSILPANVDTVVRYEDLKVENGVATITIDTIKNGQNIHQKGEDLKANDLVVPINTRISPAEIGVGASIGKAMVKVAKLPKIMVISTGDELVKIDEIPFLHQIRRSNVYRLVTTLQQYNIKADSAHLNDSKAEIRDTLSQFLDEYDAIILSGGVSKGKFDFIPEILEELGVQKLFHRVKQRPGKPFWFGQYQQKCTIFALPGNPVSSFMCMQRYFKYWLHLCQTGNPPETCKAVLGQDISFKPSLTYFLEVQLRYSATGQVIATPQKGNGSGDLTNIVKADAFLELPSDRIDFKKGEVFPFYMYR